MTEFLECSFYYQWQLLSAHLQIFFLFKKNAEKCYWIKILMAIPNGIPFNYGQKRCGWIQCSNGFIATNDDFLSRNTSNSLISSDVICDATTQFCAKHFHLNEIIHFIETFNPCDCPFCAKFMHLITHIFIHKICNLCICTPSNWKLSNENWFALFFYCICRSIFYY